MTEAGTDIGSGGAAPLPRAPQSERHAYRGPEERLERLHALLPRGLHRRDPARARVRPRATHDAFTRRYADDEVGDGLASVWYAATAIVELAAALELDDGGRAWRRRASSPRRARCPSPPRAYVLFREVVGSPGCSSCRRSSRSSSSSDCCSASTCSATCRSGVRTTAGLELHRRPRRRRSAESPHARRGEGGPPAALAALAPRRITAPRRRTVRRFGEPYAAIVGRVGSAEQSIADAYLAESAATLSRDRRARAPARALGEPRADARRVGRAAADAPRLRPPRRSDPGRPRARRRRPAAAAAGLPVHPRRPSRAGARPLRRPLVAARRARSSAARDRALARDEERHLAAARRDPPPRGRQLRRADGHRGASSRSAAIPDSLTSAQRITVFRAIQEALANVREHAGATTVEVRVRARRSAIEVRIVDDGMGFEVGRALAQAAQRGRLGLVGIGERVRMLGGTFEIDSQPGGPTTLKLTLRAGSL